MARRRTRYLATEVTKDNQPHEDVYVLAYDDAGALATLIRYGYEAAKVEALRQIRARTLRHGQPYRVDQAALQEAIDFFDLQLPVRIRYDSRAGDTNGNYRLGGCGPIGSEPNYHNIMLKTYLSVEQSNRTLWHELTHAMQAEREARWSGIPVTDRRAQSAWEHADARGRNRGYTDKPIEVEAREHEALADTLLLTVPR